MPERPLARKICLANAPGLIVAPSSTLPPRLTETFWSNVGVTCPFCSLLERTQKNELPKSPPPMNKLPFVSTSRVPHTGESGILTELIQVTPPSVDRLNCPPKSQLADVLQA